MSKKALILSGGGSNGAYQAGVLYRLYEQGQRWDFITGVSVGALNASMLATKQIEEMMSVWMNITPKKVKKPHRYVSIGANRVGHWLGIADPIEARFKNSPLKKLVREQLLGTKVETEFYAGAVRVGNDDSNEYVEFKFEEGMSFHLDNIDWCVDMIVASTAIPVYFDPVYIYGDKYFDGGVYYNTPISSAIGRYDISHATIISCNPILPQPIEQPRGIFENVSWVVSALLEASLRAEYRTFRDRNSAAQNGCSVDGYNPVYVEHEIYAPKEDLGDAMDFSTEKSRELFKKGYEEST